MRRHPIDFVQVTYSLADRRAEDRILPLARERGIAVIANRPFEQGELLRVLSRHALPPIAPELQRMSSVRALCVYSDEGDESSCPDAASSTLRAVDLPGGHHFGGDYDRVAALILEQLR